MKTQNHIRFERLESNNDYEFYKNVDNEFESHMDKNSDYYDIVNEIYDKCIKDVEDLKQIKKSNIFL